MFAKSKLFNSKKNYITYKYGKLAIFVKVHDCILQIMQNSVILWCCGAEESWEIHEEVQDARSQCPDQFKSWVCQCFKKKICESLQCHWSWLWGSFTCSTACVHCVHSAGIVKCIFPVIFPNCEPWSRGRIVWQQKYCTQEASVCWSAKCFVTCLEFVDLETIITHQPCVFS